MALNTKQLRFVELYQAAVLAGKPNATQAYIDAGYKAKGHSAESAAARLLSHVEVQQLLNPVRQTVAVIQEQQVRGIEITRDRIRLEMARLAFVNPKAFFRPDGSAIPIHELDDDTAAALAQFEVEEEVDDNGVITRTKKYKIWDKNRALTNIADTEPDVWVNPKGEAGSGNTTNVTVNLVNLTDDDLDRLDTILDAATQPARVLPAVAIPGAGEGGEGATTT